MTTLEHYFENLIFHGKDIENDSNKFALSREEQDAVWICYQYVAYTLFESRINLNKFLELTKKESVYDVLNKIKVEEE